MIVSINKHAVSLIINTTLTFSYIMPQESEVLLIAMCLAERFSCYMYLSNRSVSAVLSKYMYEYPTAVVITGCFPAFPTSIDHLGLQSSIPKVSMPVYRKSF